MPILTKMHSNCNKNHNIEYKATVMLFFIIVLNVHNYDESKVDFYLLLNCCKLGNCVMSLARLFHMCITLTVIDSSLCVVFDLT